MLSMFAKMSTKFSAADVLYVGKGKTVEGIQKESTLLQSKQFAHDVPKRFPSYNKSAADDFEIIEAKYVKSLLTLFLIQTLSEASAADGVLKTQ